MVRRIAALVTALAIIFVMCGFAEGDPGAIPAPAAENPADTAPESPAEPTEEPPAETTPEPPAKPTEEPSAEATPEPPTEPTEEPPADITPEPPTEPTGEPPVETAPAPTEEPPARETPAPTLEPEAWTESADGDVIEGTLDELVKQAREGDKIYMLSEKPVCVTDVPMEDMERLDILPDPEKFPGDRYVCRISDTAPAMAAALDISGEYILYVWVEKLPNATAEPTEKPTPVPELEIRVETQNYCPGKWSNETPVFTLSGIPEDSGRYAYAVIAYDERFIILSGNTYTAKDEGEYDLRFVILDGIGDVAAKSAKYTVQLDLTAPNGIYVQMKEGSNKKYEVSAEDALSGISEYSNDGGETWKAPNENGTAYFKGASGDVVPAGMILAKDGAGNIAAYEADFYLPGDDYGGGGGGGGGIGDGGSGTPPHAPPAEQTDLNPYNALELTLPEGPVSALTLGGVELPFTLALDSAADYEIPAGYQAMFTAKLAKWGPADAEAEAMDGEAGNADEEYDTLIISAEDDPAIIGEYAYTFAFNGVVYRMLQNSGIDYLVLQTKDGVAAISTAGFTAGTEYTRMKAEGVSTKKMDYSVLLAGDGLDETPVEMAMELSVDSETGVETYALVDEASCADGTMYYYDVQIGSIDMMQTPFGAWIMDGTAMDDMATDGEI